jgi:hypothetical protein
MIANNSCSLSFLGRCAADFKSNSRAAASFRDAQRPTFRSCGTVQRGAFGDIHKNLWIKLWIIPE